MWKESKKIKELQDNLEKKLNKRVKIEEGNVFVNDVYIIRLLTELLEDLGKATNPFGFVEELEDFIIEEVNNRIKIKGEKGN